MKTAVYPGSFDPPTNGHTDVILRASRFFDKVYVLVAKSFDKKALFNFEERVALIEGALEHESSGDHDKIEVCGWDGLTVDFVKLKSIDCILRGVRSSVDFRSEQTLANINSKLYSDCETLLFCCRPEFRDVSSSIVKEVAGYGGNLSGFVSPFVEQKLIEKIKERS